MQRDVGVSDIARLVNRTIGSIDPFLPQNWTVLHKRRRWRRNCVHFSPNPSVPVRPYQRALLRLPKLPPGVCPSRLSLLSAEEGHQRAGRSPMRPVSFA